MRTLEQITKSIIESYNNNERPNFIDVRDLDILNKKQNENTINRLKKRTSADTNYTYTPKNKR